MGMNKGRFGQPSADGAVFLFEIGRFQDCLNVEPYSKGSCKFATLQA